MFRLLLALVGLVTGLLVAAPGASAQDDTIGGNESAPDEAVFNAENRIDHRITAVRPATRVEVYIRDEDRPCAAEGVTDVTPLEDDDGEPLLDEDGEQIFDETIGCILRYHCGAERIDDVYSGAVSGPESGGVYASYIDVLTDLIAGLINIYGGPGEIPDDLGESISETVIEIGLGDPVSNDLLPVMYYCRRGPGGDLEIFDGDHDPRFEWDTEISTEYDIVTDTIVIIDALEERLRGHVPELQAIPPLDQGRTFVKFPMWFWLDEPVELDGVWAISDIGTIRIEARATLREVEWRWGEEEPLRCSLDDMRPWIQGTDPTEEVPPCSHAFTELQEFELTATAVYEIEQRISYRLSAIGTPWPDTPWTIAATPEIRVTGSAGVIDVRELLSLNVNEELDFG